MNNGSVWWMKTKLWGQEWEKNIKMISEAVIFSSKNKSINDQEAIPLEREIRISTGQRLDQNPRNRSHGLVLKYDKTFISSNFKDLRNAFYMKIKWPTLTKKKKWTDQLKSTCHFARKLLEWTDERRLETTFFFSTSSPGLFPKKMGGGSYLAYLSVLVYFSNLACLRYLAKFCVLTYFSYLACLSVLAYFCVLAYFSYLAYLSVLA